MEELSPIRIIEVELEQTDPKNETNIEKLPWRDMTVAAAAAGDGGRWSATMDGGRRSASYIVRFARELRSHWWWR